MPKFRRWPLFDQLISRYWNDETGWEPVTTWNSEDLVALELLANSELQRRGSRQGDMFHGNGKLH